MIDKMLGFLLIHHFNVIIPRLLVCEMCRFTRLRRGLPAVFLARHLYGGVAGLPAVLLAGLALPPLLEIIQQSQQCPLDHIIRY